MRSIRTKFFISFLLLIILPWLCVSSFVSSFYSRNLRERYINDALTLLTDSLNLFETNVKMTDALLHTFFVSETFSQLIPEDGIVYDSQYRRRVVEIDNFLAESISKNEFIDGALVFAKDKVLTAYKFPYWGEIIQHSNFFAQLNQSGGNTVYCNRIELNNIYFQPQSMFLMGKPIKTILNWGGRREFTDVIGSVVFMLDMQKLLNSFKPQLSGKNIQIVLLSGTELVYSDIAAETIASILQAKTEFVSKHPNNRLSGHFVQEIDGKSHVILYARSSQDYYVFGKVVSEDIYGYANQMTYIILLAQVFCIFAFFIFTTILNRFIGNPIRKLQQCMEDVPKGHLNVSVQMNSKDEIGAMCNSFNYMIGQLNEMITQIHQDHETKTKMEISMLQYQINPHFIYNILSSIRLKALMNNDEEVASMLTRVYRLFSKTIGKSGESITVAEEIENIRDFIFIYNNIFSNHINVNISIDPEIEGYYVQNMILQPIVENCFVHGITGDNKDFCVIIKGYCKEEKVVFTVSDDGIGIDQEQIERILSENKPEKYNKVGINSIHKRLKLLYGEEYGITIDSKPGCFTKVTVLVPMNREP